MNRAFLILCSVILLGGCGDSANSSDLSGGGASTSVGTTQNAQSDGTSSWGQPKSIGIGGYEGFCGQTSAANVVSMLSGVATSPAAVSQTCSDFTPGTRPETLDNYLDAATGLNWRVLSYTDGQDAMNALFLAVHAGPVKAIGLDITPTPAHIQLPSGGYHWITVVRVDLDLRQVAYNHHGRQQTATLSEFEEMWGNGYISGFVSPFTTVSLR